MFVEESCSDDEELDVMKQLIIELGKSIEINKDYYNRINRQHYILIELDKLKGKIEVLLNIVDECIPFISQFDFKDVKFNGYRSIFRIVKKCVMYLTGLLIKCSGVMVINRVQYERSRDDYIKFLLQLVTIADHLSDMIKVQKDKKSLFLQEIDNTEVYSELVKRFDTLSSDAFYGPCLGFYLCKSCQILAKIFCSIELGMGHALSLPKSTLETFISTMTSSIHNFWREQKRGKEIETVFRQSSVSFCKDFWNLVDHPVVVSVTHLVLPHLPVIKEIKIQPKVLSMESVIEYEDAVNVSPPTTSEGYAEVTVRLLSKYRRKGMEWTNSREGNYHDLSSSLLIHIHGGGFVSQSSKSHDGYLRQWAINLSCPILSIDYSHAPEFPYPRAHEECLYAYAWALQNLSTLGCSSDCKIVMCGDSAGGNLVLGCVLKVIQMNIRIPDGIFLAYPATLIEFVPSPARIIGVFCPILPMGILARCLLAYGNVNEKDLVQKLKEKETSESITKSTEQYTDKPFQYDKFDSAGNQIFYSKEYEISPVKLLLNANISRDPFMSPLVAEDELYAKLPPMSVFASEFDPLLDDSVELCKKARNAGAKKVRLRVMKDLPHGFLSLATPLTTDCMDANKLSVEEIRRLFQ